MHKGRIWPRVDRVDFSHPQAPWQTPPRQWVWRDISLSGTDAHLFPAPAWTTDLATYTTQGGFILWTTFFGPPVSGTPVCQLFLPLSLSPAWWAIGWSLGIYLQVTCSSVAAQAMGPELRNLTLPAVGSQSNPARLNVASPGVIEPLQY